MKPMVHCFRKKNTFVFQSYPWGHEKCSVKSKLEILKGNLDVDGDTVTKYENNDIVWTVYHLVIYMLSNKIHKVF